MERALYSNTSLVENTTTVKVQCHIYMHVLGSFRKDVRARRAAKTLVEAGYTVTVIDIASRHTEHSGIDNDGIAVKHMPVSQSFTSTRFKRLALLRAAWMFLQSTLYLLRTSADVYHALDLPALPACYIAARVRRKPLIFESYELPLSTLPAAELSRSRRWLQVLLAPLLRYIIPRCAGVIAVSPPIVQEMQRRFHVAEVTLIRNIPPYQAVPSSDRLRQHLHLDPEVRIALYQGNLLPDRCLDILVRAAAFLEPDIVIVMMGKGMGTMHEELAALVEHEGVADQVKIIPPAPYEELLSWTTSADLGLLIYSPDYSLNIKMCLPNKLFEFLMSGLPVLASQLEAVTDVIRTYDVGQVVLSLMPEDIGKAINMLLADRDALARMRRNALASAQQEFNWEKERQQLLNLYSSVLMRKDWTEPL